MAWDPVSSSLGSVDENVNISHSITYTDDLTLISYPVTITANEINPNTITVSGNSISGYYTDSFDNTITYRTEEGELPVVSKFSQIPISELHEMVSYKASTITSKTFSYTAVAKDGSTVIATQIYTKTVTNNWTSGKNSLQQYVEYTL